MLIPPLCQINETSNSMKKCYKVKHDLESKGLKTKHYKDDAKRDYLFTSNNASKEKDLHPLNQCPTKLW